MSDQKDIRQQLKEMAQLSILANRISEIQEKNIRSYPFIFFNDVKSVKIDYDLSKVDDDGKMNHGDHHVSYYLDLDANSNDFIIKRAEGISQATKAIFWTDLNIKVFLNNRLVYESNKNV